MNGGGGPPVDTSTFATTGSNTFVGLQTITGSLNGNVTEVTEATASILDCSIGNFFFLNLSSNTTITISLINMSPGQTINLKIKMGGNNTITLGNMISEPSASPYTPSSGANQEDILTFISFNGTSAYMSYVKNLAK